MERTECDNHDRRECSAYSYESINLCMQESFCTVILGLRSVPYLLPLPKKIKKIKKSQPQLNHSWRNHYVKMKARKT